MQNVFDSIDPAMSGTDLAGVLNDFKAALMSGLSGPTRPTELEPGGFWVDTSNDPTTWSFRLWTGSDDVEVFKVDLATGGSAVSLAVDSFTVRKVSADDVGPLIELVKRRIATSGQVKSGDVVGEIRVVGRQDNGANPVVAKIIFTAGEDNTSTAFGGTLSFWSTPVGQATMIEHMKFISGVIESIVPHKLNAIQLVSQSVATTATILQLDASKTAVELTGSTATEIHGINSGQATKQLLIHNRSSAIVTFKNQSASATAADRLLLPDSADISIKPQESATVTYSNSDSRWKFQYRSSKFGGFIKTVLYGSGVFVTPPGVSQISLSTGMVFTKVSSGSCSSLGVLEDGSVYGWGQNNYGVLGNGGYSTGVASPGAVVGGIKFARVFVGAGEVGDTCSAGITADGVAYTWGRNQYGQLGVGDTNSRSSPVPVVGGLNFSIVEPRRAYTVGLTTEGVAYGWGFNYNGQLGLGDTINRSSPSLVLGGLKFSKITAVGNSTVLAITEDGTAYTWGGGSNGLLGDGTLISRSSPVAIPGGLKFTQISGGVLAHFLALTADGTAYAWGSNAWGQLGTGDNIERSTPTAVAGGLKFVDIKAGYSTSIAITADGTAYCWGTNQYGALGTGDLVGRSTPTAVVGGLKFSSIGTGGIQFFSFSTGVTQDGTAYAWGRNDTYNALGTGDAVNRSTPTLVTGGFNFSGRKINGESTVLSVSGSINYRLVGAGSYFGNKFLGSATVAEITYPAP